MPSLSRWASLLTVGLVLTGPVRAEEPVRTDKLGRSFDALTLTDADGNVFRLNEQKGPKAVVVVFLSFDCPVSNSYASFLGELSRTRGKDGVTVLGIVPTDDTPAEVKKHAAEYKLPFPVFPDPKRLAAEAFKAQATPEVFVLDHNFVLRYRGRIDDAQKSRTQKNPVVTTHELLDALAAVLAGKDVAVPATRPVGCAIIPVERKPAANASVTFYKDVQPILQSHCVECHRPGQVGPFSLVTYKQAVNWADDIRDYTRDRKMPPWKPHGGPEYTNTRQMPAASVATLAKWVEAGCPEGDAKDAPPTRTFSDEWKLGQPDLVLEVPEDFHVGATGRDLFRCFVFPNAVAEDKFVVGYEVKPGNPRVVHHTLNFYDTTGQGRELLAKQQATKLPPEVKDYGPGYSTQMGVGFFPDPTKAKGNVPSVGQFGGWAPGQLATRTPAGTGFALPNGADVIIQVHYHRTGKPETDRTKIGLYFAKDKVDRPFQNIAVGGMTPWTVIPAGNPEYKAGGSVWLRDDCTLYSVLPHMHLIGRSIKVTLTPKDGPTTTLVDIPSWDYNWQETYWFKNPIPAKAGTRLEVSAVYDNSSHNLNNPYSPPNPIYFGEQTTSEMLFGFVGVSSKEAGQRVRFSRTPLDKDGNPTPAKGLLQQFVPRPMEPVPKKADDKKKGEAKAIDVPYQLTDTKHVRVRVKLNGQGPYNLILDTGAPAAFVTKAVAMAAGLTPDEKGWAPVKSFAVEGGLTVDKARVRVEDLFQLEGMNGLGLAGVELHGVIGYDILAKYRVTYDFTADKLAFVPLNGFTPPAIQGIGGKGGQGGLEVLGPLMKTLAAFAGIKPNFDYRPRGHVGIEVEEKDGGVFVKAVLAGSPAETAGLKVGDKLRKVNDRSIDAPRDLGRALNTSAVGARVKFQILRGEESSTLTVALGKGI